MKKYGNSQTYLKQCLISQARQSSK